MGRDMFRLFKPDSQSEDKVAKRRGQLRRAQQTFRERKERYTKCIETELAATRAREANLAQQCERLRATNAVLAQLLSHNGINVPSDLLLEDSVNSSPPPHADLSESSKAFNPHDYDNSFNGLTLPTPFFDQTPTPVSSSGGSPGAPVSVPFGREKYIGSQSPSTTEWVNRSQLLASPQHSATPLQNTDDATVGMEFVLILESPCLDHLHGDPSKPEELNCHAFTASAQLLTSDLPPDMPPICAPGMKDPAAILNRLLALSPEICSDTDVTPIQMWNRIRQQPHSGSLALQRLRTLAEKLRDAAKCHGFGAVVDSQIFEKFLVEAVMPRAF